MAAAVLCFVTLLAFCFLAPAALMLGYYHGSPELVVIGSGCSRLVETNSFFAQDIKARTEGGSPENGLVLYGMPVAPPLGVPAAWSEARRAVVPANSHMEWVYFLNRGSEIEVAYSVRSETESSRPICMIIARGKESFLQWAENPSANETTLSWHLVHGNGTIKQTINLSSEYFIALGNFNNQDVTVNYPVSRATELPKCFCGIFSLVTEVSSGRVAEEDGSCPLCRRKLKKVRRIFSV
ncbi:Os05g0521000 [Oryza sativa Japonica Group]|uniref:Os05g0521000 protein n=1 Tax=Oryza sativa subsp. japonica TaxID=39947 RepID=A0A0P0WPM1_ORYSJ|nr:Os05g0521000 [Oryza sativa Japonica Group]